MGSPQQAVADVVEAADRSGATGEVLWRVRSDDGRVDVTHGDPDRPFFIASATKLYVTAILAQLRQEGRLSWDDTAARHLPPGLVDPLPRGRDLTIRELLAHTSGLPDYFEDRRPDGPTTFARIRHLDRGWTLADVVAWSARQAPQAPGRGHYSDTGYQVLGGVIEHVTGMTFGDAVRVRVSERIGQVATWVFGRESIVRYDDVATMRFGKDPLVIPRAMASVQADGGIVSTVTDGVRFVDAFFCGELFEAALLSEIMADWHRIFRPLEYGTGIMRFRLPAAYTGFRRVPPFYGHSGVSGTVLFRCPDLGLTVVGTVNQVRGRSRPYRLMVRSALAARRRPTVK
jgi:CubicO group peptidase (beta-lactamase class C family)